MGLVPEDGVEHGEEFAGDGDVGDKLGFAGLEEALTEGAQHRVVARCDHGGHDMAAMKRAVRTAGLPPPVKLLPRHCPDWRVQGARPARAAAWRRSSWPSSGSSAIRVRATVLPMPGTEASNSSFSRQAGEPRTA